MTSQAMWSVISIFFWLVVAAFFSGVETGMYSLNRFRLGARAKEGDGNAERLQRLLGRPWDLICTLLLGTNISIYVMTMECTRLINAVNVWPSRMLPALVTTVVLSPLVLVFAEMIPKAAFRRRSELLPYAASRAVAFFTVLLRVPVVALRSIVALVERMLGMEERGGELLFSREQLADLITVGAREGSISDYQADMARKVMRLNRVRLSDVMMPLERVTMVEEDTSLETFLNMAEGRRHSRIPVFDRTRENVVGVVNIFDLFYEPEKGTDVSAYVTQVIRMKSDTLTVIALKALQAKKRVMALVVDSNDVPVGIVTVKDLVEEIAGELGDW